MRTSKRSGSWYSVAVVAGASALILAACGGKSGSSTTPNSRSSAQKVGRLEVHVVRGSASAPAASMLARLGDLLGWPRTAEAATCTVTANGVAGATDASGTAVLVNVPVPANGILPVNVACSDGSGGAFSLTATGGTNVTVTVEVEPGQLEVKVKDQQVSQVSQPSQPSKPSGSRSGSNSGSD
jgi:hypothetical protein